MFFQVERLFDGDNKVYYMELIVFIKDDDHPLNRSFIVATGGCLVNMLDNTQRYIKEEAFLMQINEESPYYTVN